MKIAAIDIGGTFTDCVVFDQVKLLSLKVPSTPPELENGLLNALAKAAQLSGQSLRVFLSDLPLILQGTTAALNTVLTRTGAKVGLITTKGFRDVIETRRGIRTGSPYNMFQPPYEPVVPRYLRHGVNERTRYTGEILQGLDEKDLDQAMSALGKEGIESIAVCFLYSYLNATNERAAAKRLAERFPEMPVSQSSEVLPVWREYERFSTTVINAYVAPKLAKHLSGLETRLGDAGFRGRAMLMTGSGLLESPEYCSRRAVHLLGSGPAGSANAALHISRTLDLRNAISVDMGGTSFDVCLVRDGHINTTSDTWIEGHRVAVKTIDSESIGAGGGSIAWVDSRRLLRVGPQSAGAVPGPACYGGGGKDATVTDANLVMGFLATSTFKWGELTLDLQAAQSAVARIGDSLGLTLDAAATAIYETVNEVMANGIIRLTTQRGIDPRDFVLVAGGGAGAIHAAAIAKRVGLGKVIVPSYAGVYSAFGIMACDRGVEAARSYRRTPGQSTADALNQIYAQLEKEAIEHLRADGIGDAKVVLRRTADMRYVRQYHEVEVEVPEGRLTDDDVAAIVRRFHEVHRRQYTFAIDSEESEFLTFRLRASTVSKVSLPPARAKAKGEPTPGRSRQCLAKGKRVAVPVFSGERLNSGHHLEGPALIEEPTTTIYVPPGFSCEMDAWRNYAIESK